MVISLLTCSQPYAMVEAVSNLNADRRDFLLAWAKVVGTGALYTHRTHIDGSHEPAWIRVVEGELVGSTDRGPSPDVNEHIRAQPGTFEARGYFSRDHLVHLHFVTLDLDEDGEAQLQRLLADPVVPAPWAVVNSSTHNRHVWWWVDLSELETDACVEVISNLQRSLAARFGADPTAASSAAGNVRLPGSYNTKRGDMCTLRREYFRPDSRLTLEDFAQLPLEASVRRPLRQARKEIGIDLPRWALDTLKALGSSVTGDNGDYTAIDKCPACGESEGRPAVRNLTLSLHCYRQSCSSQKPPNGGGFPSRLRNHAHRLGIEGAEVPVYGEGFNPVHTPILEPRSADPQHDLSSDAYEAVSDWLKDRQPNLTILETMTGGGKDYAVGKRLVEVAVAKWKDWRRRRDEWERLGCPEEPALLSMEDRHAFTASPIATVRNWWAVSAPKYAPAWVAVGTLEEAQRKTREWSERYPDASALSFELHASPLSLGCALHESGDPRPGNLVRAGYSLPKTLCSECPHQPSCEATTGRVQLRQGEGPTIRLTTTAAVLQASGDKNPVILDEDFPGVAAAQLKPKHLDAMDSGPRHVVSLTRWCNAWAPVRDAIRATAETLPKTSGSYLAPIRWGGDPDLLPDPPGGVADFDAETGRCSWPAEAVSILEDVAHGRNAGLIWTVSESGDWLLTRWRSNYDALPARTLWTNATAYILSESIEGWAKSRGRAILWKGKHMNSENLSYFLVREPWALRSLMGSYLDQVEKTLQRLQWEMDVAGVERGKILIATYKSLVEPVQKMVGDSAKVDYYERLKGVNDYEDFDALILLGNPNPGVGGQEWANAELNGQLSARLMDSLGMQAVTQTVGRLRAIQRPVDKTLYVYCVMTGAPATHMGMLAPASPLHGRGVRKEKIVEETWEWAGAFEPSAMAALMRASKGSESVPRALSFYPPGYDPTQPGHQLVTKPETAEPEIKGFLAAWLWMYWSRHAEHLPERWLKGTRIPAESILVCPPQRFDIDSVTGARRVCSGRAFAEAGMDLGDATRTIRGARAFLAFTEAIGHPVAGLKYRKAIHTDWAEFQQTARAIVSKHAWVYDAQLLGAHLKYWTGQTTREEWGHECKRPYHNLRYWTGQIERSDWLQGEYPPYR